MHALYVVQLHKELVRSKRLSGGPVAYLRSTEWAIKTVLYIILFKMQMHLFIWTKITHHINC